METVKWDPNKESIKDPIWDTKQILPHELMKCIIKTVFYPSKKVLDPKNLTIKDNRWDPKQILHNEKLNCITQTEWYPN